MYITPTGCYQKRNNRTNNSIHYERTRFKRHNIIMLTPKSLLMRWSSVRLQQHLRLRHRHQRRTLGAVLVVCGVFTIKPHRLKLRGVRWQLMSLQRALCLRRLDTKSAQLDPQTGSTGCDIFKKPDRFLSQMCLAILLCWFNHAGGGSWSPQDTTRIYSIRFWSGCTSPKLNSRSWDLSYFCFIHWDRFPQTSPNDLSRSPQLNVSVQRQRQCLATHGRCMFWACACSFSELSNAPFFVLRCVGYNIEETWLKGCCFSTFGQDAYPTWFS